MTIDFSKAPDSDFFESLFWLYDSDLSNGCSSRRMLFKEYCAKVLYNNYVITCNNNHEVMLCQQVLRMWRDEASEHKCRGQWFDADKALLNICDQYRAKPKKELIIPWEWLPDDVTELTIAVNKIIYNNRGYTVALKLDLTDIELPVTVPRPQR